MWAAFHDVQPNPYMDGNKRPLSEAKNQRPAEVKRLTPNFSWLSYFSVIIFLCVIFLICFKVLSLRCFQICERAVFILFRIMQVYLGPNSCKFHSYVGWVTPKSLGPWFRPFSTVRLPLQTLQREQTGGMRVSQTTQVGGVPSVSYDYQNKLSQHLWLKAIAIYSPTVLQIRKQAETSWSCMKIKVLAGPQSLREALEEKPSLASSIDRCWCSWLVTPPLHCCLWGHTAFSSRAWNLLCPPRLTRTLWWYVLPAPRIQDDLPISRYFFNISFWLLWAFIAACRLSLVTVSRGYSSLQCAGFSLRWLL